MVTPSSEAGQAEAIQSCAACGMIFLRPATDRFSAGWICTKCEEAAREAQLRRRNEEAAAEEAAMRPAPEPAYVFAAPVPSANRPIHWAVWASLAFGIGVSTVIAGVVWHVVWGEPRPAAEQQTVAERTPSQTLTPAMTPKPSASPAMPKSVEKSDDLSAFKPVNSASTPPTDAKTDEPTTQPELADSSAITQRPPFLDGQVEARGSNGKLDTTPPPLTPSQAWDEIYMGHLSAAGFYFSEILKKTPDDRDSQIGQSIAEAGDPDNAQTHKQGLAALEKLNGDKPDEISVVNLAAAMLAENPLRSGRALADYLKSAPAVTEPAVNALGTAIVQCGKTGKPWSIIEGLAQQYVASDQKLDEAAKDGRKRWGSEWVAADVADHNWIALQEAVDGSKVVAAQSPAAAFAGRVRAMMGPIIRHDDLMATAEKPSWPDKIDYLRPASSIVEGSLLKPKKDAPAEDSP